MHCIALPWQSMMAWRWSRRKKTIKLEGGQLVHYRAAVIIQSFRVTGCVKLEKNQDKKPATAADARKSLLPHQLLVRGSDRPPPSIWSFLVPKKAQQQQQQQQQDHQIELVLGFDSLEECQQVLEAAASIVSSLIGPQP